MSDVKIILILKNWMQNLMTEEKLNHTVISVTNSDIVSTLSTKFSKVRSFYICRVYLNNMQKKFASRKITSLLLGAIEKFYL